ncbi:MAG: tyrosine-type recombinase/integrase [Flavonifractor plautii]
MSDAQAAQLMAAVHGTAVEPFVALGLYAGLRKEEILGLRWANVHLSGPAPYISVRERVVYVCGKAVHEAELKSKAARRSIPMPTPLLECLRSYRIRCPHEFVICNPAGGPRSEASFRRLWQMVANRTVGEGEKLGDKVRNHRVVKSLDFHVSPHVLRHTYITNLCKSGMNIKTIQYLAGHATAALTLSIYVHAVNNTPEELAEDVNRAFGVLEKDTKSDTDTSNTVVSIAAQ